MTDVDRDELVAALAEGGTLILDVRTAAEYDGSYGYPCDAQQGHIPGARNLDVQVLLGLDHDGIRSLVGAPAGSSVIVYCHSGSRSGVAAHLLREAGYEARNYVGSWHEWSNDPELPVEPAT